MILFTSCRFEPNRATKEKIQEKISQADFQIELINDIERFKILKDFLYKNVDSLISFRNSRNIVIQVSGNSKTDTLLQKQECYTYFRGNSQYDLNSVPDFLKNRLDSIWKLVGQDVEFSICKDKKIKIVVKNEKVAEGLYISHEFIWNISTEREKNKIEYSAQKDSILTNDCIYRIGLTEQYGH
jgi:hypothetical protein